VKKLARKKQSTEHLKRERWAPKSWYFRKHLFRIIQRVILLERRLGAGLQPEDKTSKVWEGSIEVPGNATNKLGVVAKKADVYLIIGVIEGETETSGGTLYGTVLFFGPSGGLLGKHRKLKPTAAERIIWGEGRWEHPSCF